MDLWTADARSVRPTDTSSMGQVLGIPTASGPSSDEISTLASRCRFALSALPEGSMLAGMTAARLQGLWLPPPAPGERVEVVLHGVERVPRDLARTRRVDIHGRRRRITRSETAFVDGLPVSSAERTWVDLAAVLPAADLVAAGDSVLRGDTSHGMLARTVAAARGRRGVVAARAALPLLNPMSRSRPESHLRFVLVAGGLPEPEINHAIHDEHGQWLAEPDLVYRRARIALEYNGAVHADPARMRRDITRGLDVVRADWLLLTFGPAQVFARPQETVGLVRSYLDARDPGWRSRRAS